MLSDCISEVQNFDDQINIFTYRIRPILQLALQDVTAFKMNQHKTEFLKFMNCMADFVSYVIGDTHFMIEKNIKNDQGVEKP